MFVVSISPLQLLALIHPPDSLSMTRHKMEWKLCRIDDCSVYKQLLTELVLSSLYPLSIVWFDGQRGRHPVILELPEPHHDSIRTGRVGTWRIEGSSPESLWTGREANSKGSMQSGSGSASEATDT